MLEVLPFYYFVIRRVFSRMGEASILLIDRFIYFTILISNLPF